MRAPWPPTLRPADEPASVALTAPAAVAALLGIVGDPALVRRIAAAYPTWAALAAAGVEDRARRVGPWAAAYTFAATCPPLPSTFAGCDPTVDMAGTATVLWWRRGDPLERRPVVAVTGGRWPSPTGLAIITRAVSAAAAAGAAVAVTGDGPVFAATLDAAAAADAPLVWVTPSDPDRSPLWTAAGRDVTGTGGQVVWPHTPTLGWDEPGRAAAGQLLVERADVVVVVDAGPHDSGGGPVIAAALRAGKPLVVPAAGTHPVGLVRGTHAELLDRPDAVARLLGVTPAAAPATPASSAVGRLRAVLTASLR